MATETVQATMVGGVDEWTLVAGASKAAAVNAPDDGTASYIRCSTTSGLTQWFQGAPSLPAGSIISQVDVTARCRRGDSQDANYVVGYSFNIQGGGTQTGESGTLTAPSAYSLETYSHSGLSVAYGDVLGWYIRNTQARRVECTLLELTLTYTPAAAGGVVPLLARIRLSSKTGGLLTS